MKLVVDLSKPKGEREQYIPLSEEELAQRDTIAAEIEAEQAAREKAAADLAAAKQAAQDKLAALGLTEAEIAAITGA
jgi:hypothetical protein